MDFFNDEIVEQSGNEIFEGEYDPEAKSSEFDVKLATFGIESQYAYTFMKNFPTSNVLSVKTGLPNPKFFQYYLDSCDAPMLRQIKHGKLSPGLFKLYENTEPITLDRQKNGEPIGDMSTIEQYIERNAELIKKFTNAQEVSQKYVLLNQEGKEHVKRLSKDNDILCKQLAFLYVLMSKKMDFTKEVTDKEIKMIEEIKEVMEE